MHRGRLLCNSMKFHSVTLSTDRKTIKNNSANFPFEFDPTDMRVVNHFGRNLVSKMKIFVMLVW